jgi:peptidoglycan hydrolase-like protein with peptidoglycan-binding domain
MSSARSAHRWRRSRVWSRLTMSVRTLPIALLLTVAAALCVRPCAASADAPFAKRKSPAAAHAGAASGSAKGASTRDSAAKPGAAKASKHRTVSSKSGAVTSTALATGKSAARKSSGKSSVTKSGKRTSSKSSSRHAPGQKAPTPERITEIQQALAKKGSLSSEPSGKWDDATTEGMRRFQAAHGLNPTGKLDALTLRQLGLGSTTAGMGAPTISSKASASTLASDVAAPQ